MDSISSRFRDAVSEWIVNNPVWAIGISLLMIVCAGAGIDGYKYSLDHRVFFSSDNPQLQAFDELQKDYSKTDTVMIVLAPKSGSVFTPEFLTVLKDATEKSWSTPYSQRVESITNFQKVVVDGDTISSGDLIDNPKLLTKDQISEIKSEAIVDPFLVNALVNKEGTVAGIRITLNLPGKEQMKEVPEVVRYVRALADSVESKSPNISTHLAGQTVIANYAFQEESQKDFVRVWPWFALTMITVLTWLFRSVKAMVVTFAACVLAIVAGAGFIGYFKPMINDAVIVAPIMILSMAFADGIHLIVNWIQGIHLGRDKYHAMAQSLKDNMGAMTITSVMTIAGFMTLHFNDSPPFRIMGYIVAAGVFFTLFLTLFFIAPLLLLLPGKPPQKIALLMREDSSTMEKFASFVISHRFKVLVVIGGIAIFLISFIGNNKINDDTVKYYSKNAEFRKDMEFVNENLTGIGDINYSLPGVGDDGIMDPSYLKKVDEFSEWLKTQKNVTQVNSLADIIKRVNQKMHGDDPSYYRIPDSREEIAQYLLQYEMSMPYGMDLNYLVKFDRSKSRVRVSVNSSSGTKVIEIDTAAKAWLAKNAPVLMHVEGSSLSLMFAHIGERSIGGMLGGMIGMLAIESLFVALVFGAFRLGVSSFIGNIVPIAMAFGLWGLVNGNIDVGLTVVLGISFSIVVDDTIHFLHKYEHARRQGLSVEDAIKKTFRLVGFALISTTLVLGLGYMWLANSNIQITINTAIVTTTTILFALIVDMFLLPTIFILTDKREFPRLEKNDGATSGVNMELPGEEAQA